MQTLHLRKFAFTENVCAFGLIKIRLKSTNISGTSLVDQTYTITYANYEIGLCL